jgi:UDP-N-acetylmuramate--alanine ligase
MFKTDRKIHFVGIGGIGMSGIAEVLLTLGYRVSGSDIRRSAITDRLETLGANIQIGHRAENVGDSFVVVISSAVSADNPEVVSAHEKLIPVIPRAEMLAELMRMKYGVAVAGAHGKTTTTSMVATILSEAGLDPTVVVGGKIGKLGSNARLGQGKFLVAEADESDGSFLLLAPTVAVITNIDREHMNHYLTEEAIERAFIDFANKVPFYGAVILCLEDARVQGILPCLKRRTITYGLGRQADLYARHITMSGGKTTFEVVKDQKTLAKLTISLPGQHNVLNALAAFCVGLELGAAPETIASALEEFGGVDRRSQIKGEAGGVIVMDDYAHHPTEIEAALKGLREAWDRRIIALFQPHRYSRTQDLAERFHTAFYSADCVFVTDIYPAGEAPIEGVDGQSLVEGIRLHGHRFARHAGNWEEAAAAVAAEAREGDLIVTLGAGNIWQASEKILSILSGSGRNE